MARDTQLGRYQLIVVTVFDGRTGSGRRQLTNRG